MSYAKDPRVDAYIDPLPEWQQRLCHRVRDLVHAADPEGIITAGRENKTARTVAFREGEPINEPALTAMFRR